MGKEEAEAAMVVKGKEVEKPPAGGMLTRVESSSSRLSGVGAACVTRTPSIPGAALPAGAPTPELTKKRKK